MVTTQATGPRAVRATPSSALIWTALLTVYLVWGSTYLAIRVAVRTIPPFLGAGTRFLVAGAVLAGILVARRGPGVLRVTRRELGNAALVGALLLAGGNGLVVIAEQRVPSGLAALVVAAVPLWVVVLRLLTRDRPRRATVLGVLLGFAGIIVLLLPGGQPGSTHPIGVLTVLIASLSWSIGSFLSGRIRMPRDPFVTTTYEMLCGGALLLPAGIARGELHDFSLDQVGARPALALAYLIVFGSLVAFTAYVWLLQAAPISLVATYAYVNPAVAVGLGALLLSEQITAGVLIGGAIVVLAVGLVVSTESRARSRAQAVLAPAPAAAAAAQSVTVD